MTQTESLSVADGCCQHPESSAMATQCTARNTRAQVKDDQVDFDKLAAFLRTNMPMLKKEIEKSIQTFNRWKTMERLWKIEDTGPIQLHHFSSEHVVALQETNSTKARWNFIVSCVCYNANASMLAVAYRVNEQHGEWCAHESFLFFWNLYKTYDRLSKPSMVLDIDSGCVSTIEAHPRHSSVYAIGTMRGKVLVVNTRYEGATSGNESYIRASTENVSHQDVVTCIHWLRDEHRKDQLISLGLDGRMFVWKLSNDTKRNFQLVTAFVILVQDLPRSLGIKNSEGVESQVGITSASFSQEDIKTFIVGCHGGAMFQCTLNSTTEAAQQPSSEIAGLEQHSYLTPITITYVPHRAHVNSMQFSPSLRNTFLSSGGDGELRIYSLLNTKPLSVIHCPSGISRASWSITNATCIYALQETGILCVYNFDHSAKKSHANKPIRVIELGDRLKVVSFEPNFNERLEHLAITFTNGDTSIYDLSKALPMT